MSSTDHTKPTGKSGRRNKKAEQRRQKSDSLASPTAVRLQSPEPVQPSHPEPQPDQVQSVMADLEPVVDEPIDTMAASPDALPTAALAAVEPAPVSLQTIANAYRDYTRKSFEEIGSYFEQLTGVRSLDKAMKVQTEFVKRTYENSVAESQRICELHNKLARQTLQPFQGLAGKTPDTHGKS